MIYLSKIHKKALEDLYQKQREAVPFGFAPPGTLAYEPYKQAEVDLESSSQPYNKILEKLKQNSWHLTELSPEEQDILAREVTDTTLMHDLIKYLEQHPEQTPTLLQLIYNPNTPEEILIELIDALPEAHRRDIIQHPNFTSKVLNLLLFSLNENPSSNLFLAILNSPLINEGHLRDLSKLEPVRFKPSYIKQILKHPKMSPALEKELRDEQSTTFLREGPAQHKGWITKAGKFYAVPKEEHYLFFLQNKEIFNIPYDDVVKFIRKTKATGIDLLPWIMEKSHAVRVVGLMKGSLWMQAHSLSDAKAAEDYIFQHLQEVKDIRIETKSGYYYTTAEDFKEQGFDAFQRAPGAVVFSKLISNSSSYPLALKTQKEITKEFGAQYNTALFYFFQAFHNQQGFERAIAYAVEEGQKINLNINTQILESLARKYATKMN